MNAQEKHSYRPLPLCDTHLHPADLRPLADTAATLRDVVDWFAYRRAVLCCLTDTLEVDDPLANVKALYLKDTMNAQDSSDRILVYGHPLHRYDGRDTAEGYLAQAQQLHSMGVDGIKLLDGKPECRRRIGRPLCDPIYDAMYAYLEDVGLPVKLHLGDPAFFWGSREAVGEYVVRRGWWYGAGDYPTLETMRAEVETLLARFPRLRLCLAHFGFFADEPDRLRALMEKYQNLTIDLTPGGEMFVSMTTHHDVYLAFFADHRDRIFFGTDTYNSPVPGEGIARCDRAGGSRYHLVRRMLEGDPTDRFTLTILGREETLRPLGLDDAVLRPIYADNHLAFHPSVRPVNRPAVAAALAQIDPTDIAPAYAEIENENLRVLRKWACAD